MSKTTISAGQSLLDVALQECGSVASLFDLADANDGAITDLLTPGQVLEVPASAAARPDLVGYYAARAYRVNTGANENLITPPARIMDFDPTDFNPNDFLA